MPHPPIPDEWLDTLPLDHDEFSTSPAEKAAVLVMPAPADAGCGECSPFRDELSDPQGFYVVACRRRVSSFIAPFPIRAERRQ